MEREQTNSILTSLEFALPIIYDLSRQAIQNRCFRTSKSKSPSLNTNVRFLSLLWTVQAVEKTASLILLHQSIQNKYTLIFFKTRSHEVSSTCTVRIET